MHPAIRSFRFTTFALALTLLALPALAATPVAHVELGFNQVTWTPQDEFAGLKLTVSGPEGTWQQSFGPNESPQLDLSALGASVDGHYSWELRATPYVNDINIKGLSRTSGTTDTTLMQRPKSLPPLDSLVQSGSFLVVNGTIVQPAAEAAAPSLNVDLPSSGNGAATSPLERVTALDQVINDDLIVDGSACIGFDCANGLNFGFDTLILKENNVRLFFDDTSSSGSFPANDWRLVANESSNGGNNWFQIEDATAGRAPFTIEAGASANSLYVEADGDVGVGTSQPVVNIHIVEGNTPTLRLEQDGSSGFQAQTYDVAANEANFFIRDVTNGSRLFFRSKPGAPENSIFIAANGDVGLGTASPGDRLHVQGGGARIEDTSNVDLFVTLEDGSGTALTTLQATATANTAFFGTATSDVMAFVVDGTERMRINTAGRVSIGCQNPLNTTDFTVQSVTDGNADCGTAPFSRMAAGDTTFTVSSSRSMKENLVPVKPEGFLEKIANVDVYEYDFIGGPTGKLGLMAEDFHTVFNRGEDAMLNGQEVQMALWLAVKELAADNQQLREELEELKSAKN